MEHIRVIAEIGEIIKDIPLVFDREFSYELFLSCLIEDKMNFVIRLNTKNNVKIRDEFKREVSLVLKRGEVETWKDVYYKGKIKVNIIGCWEKGFKEPLYVMTNLESKRGLEIYKKRMLIEESYKDLKSLLGIDKNMCMREDRMEKMMSIAFISYMIGLIVGEELRKIGIVYATHLFSKEKEIKSRCFKKVYIDKV